MRSTREGGQTEPEAGMNEVQRVREQLRRAVHGGAWHGPGLMELLGEVDHERAAARSLAGAHTIEEIVAHLEAWFDVVRRRLAGEVVEPTPAEDWPRPGDGSAAAWRARLDGVMRAHDALQAALAPLDDDALRVPVPANPYDAYVMLHGTVQHVTYHAGQIALLRK